MKIGIIHTAKSYGGSVISLIDMLEMLRPGHEVTVYMSAAADSRAVAAVTDKGARIVLYEKEPVLFAHYSGFDSVFRLGFWHGLFYWTHSRYWTELLTGNREEAVFLNSSVLTLFGVMLKRRTRLKTVCYNRETHNTLLLGLPDRCMQKLLSRQDAVIFLSRSEQKHFRLPNRSWVLADVLNPVQFPPGIEKAEARRTLGLAQNRFYILFMGGFSKLKGTLTLLEAMARLRTKDASLLLLGDPESGDQGYAGRCLEAIREAGNVELVGLRRDVPLYYCAADVLVFPSARDHQARPILEAGYYGVPAVISDFEGTREFLRDRYNGRCFPPGDASALAQILDELCENGAEREELGRHNRIMTEKLHSMEQGKKKLDAVLASL